MARQEFERDVASGRRIGDTSPRWPGPGLAALGAEMAPQRENDAPEWHPSGGPAGRGHKAVLCLPRGADCTRRGQPALSGPRGRQPQPGAPGSVRVANWPVEHLGAGARQIAVRYRSA